MSTPTPNFFNQRKERAYMISDNQSICPKCGGQLKFKDVGVYDLGDGLTLADYIKVGSNVKIQAKVRSYNSDTGLFELDPVSVEAR